MSEASENNTKPHFGVYTLTPKNAPFYTAKTKAPYWKLKGWTIWGDRVRIRYELWEAGNTAQRQYEDADKEWLKSHKKPNQPVIIVSNSLDAVRLAEATRAVALLPRDPETDLPDRLATLDDGIAIALQSGWNPRASAATVNDLSDDFVKRITARNSLTWNDENYLSDAAFSIHVRAQRHAVAIFGSETLKTINSKERQCAIIEALPKDTSQSVKVQALYGLGSLLHDLVGREQLGIVRIYKLPRNKILSIPEVMSIPQQQEYLDEFWFTAFAAAAVARLHLGVRPWSELGKSKSDDIKYGLSSDYRSFLVKADSKTGWRALLVPPVARVLFARLDKEGRLSKERNRFGYHIIYEGNPGTWTHHYAKLGYTSNPNLNARVGVSEETLREQFRKQFPVKYGEYIPDFTRKTHITVFLVTSDGEKDRCATFHGNSGGTIDDHYAGLMSPAEAVLSCRLIPTWIRGDTSLQDIALPNYCAIPLSDEDKIEYAMLVEQLPKYSPEMANVTYAKQRSETAKAVWAARKARPDFKQSAVVLKMQEMSVSNPRNGHSRETFKQRLAVLVKYATDFPEGFRQCEVRGIVQAAGLECLLSRDWITKIVAPDGPFTIVKGMYVLNGSSSKEESAVEP